MSSLSYMGFTYRDRIYALEPAQSCGSHFDEEPRCE